MRIQEFCCGVGGASESGSPVVELVSASESSNSLWSWCPRQNPVIRCGAGVSVRIQEFCCGVGGASESGSSVVELV